MFKKGEMVSYSTTGLCEITDVTSISEKGIKTEYYVLQPIYQKTSKIYVPVNNETLVAKMRSVITKKEVDDIILKAKDDPMEWIENDIKRNEVFKEIYGTGDLSLIIKMIGCIYIHGKELAQSKRRLRAADSIYFQNAEQLVNNELAYVLNINPNEVTEYIKLKMK